ncbi:bifunctional diguanylate cyclase/phosphodiesterase [Bradyrhizobium sp. CB82]|uniref:putative bifunctional diguanylate cyclase/phosphodiesterase n=1 Tax=Bradyrhizobium sp. CB82 TaxID=3039159 RepID=UPI0024B0F953|nr:bifunctional diguanylate cyclase/phosphodiesterase [Bradyrhizobium sp. CB82]WFU43579.1 bifunctional diguanylate cyclase/phosphodiesterase [Bradyrhizobium sp. CB82]
MSFGRSSFELFVSAFKSIEMIVYHGLLHVRHIGGGTYVEGALSHTHFLGSKLLKIAPREIIDALVIFSISVISYHLAMMDWGGFSILGAQQEQPLFLYFVGIALVVFSIRRIIDQRNERVRRVAAEQHAHDVSMRDPLTQLPNRAKFEVEASARLRRPNSRMTVLLLGLSQFKRLHDVYGHLGCDAALLQVARRLQDRIDCESLFARIGDDEFALSLSHVDPEVASKIASSLVEDVKEPVQIGIEHLSLGANVGIAQAGRGQVTVDELLRCAHVALSRARNNRAEYCFFDPMMDAHVRERSLLELDLVAAIGKHEIQPYYQPIVDLKSRQIVGFEALARWQHPVTGFIPPDKFIPVAEELGQMELLSRRLLGDACRDALTWPDEITLSFNFSPSQLSDRRFADEVLSILSDTGLPAHRLEAEITENAIVTDIDATRHAIETLRNSGVRIAIDDFGTGYSSLSHLYELRFDKLKIDRRFVQELGMTSESDIFMRAIIGLCGGLNLCTTAEGIETEAQALAATRHGVHQAQGFLFSKAICSRSVMQLLSTSSRSQRVA